MSLLNGSEEFDTYPIYMNKAANFGALIKISPNLDDIPIEALKTFRIFKSIGFFTEPENKIVYATHKPFIVKDDSYYYALVYSLNDDSRVNTLASIGVNAYTTTTKRSLFATNIGSLDNIHVNDLPSIVKQRFSNHKFTPVNGWEFMYYLDLITNFSYNWTEHEIRILDQLKTDGLSMDAASLMLGRNFTYENMKEGIGLPLSWIEKAYGKVRH